MRRLITHVKQFWPPICAAVGATGALALLWLVRDTPLELGANIRVDALSAFFGLVVLSGLTLSLARASRIGSAPRHAFAAIVLLLVLSTTLTPAIAVGYLVLALLVHETAPINPGGRPWLSRATLVVLSQRAVGSAPWPLAAACLLLGYAGLALRGALRYTDIAAGTALDSFVFWFVILAAALPIAPFRSHQANPTARSSWFGAPALALAWSYPLVRLYSIGPWNTGWSLAAVLLGAGLAGWCSLSAFAERDREVRFARLLSASYAMVLTSFGLATSAGIAAACFGMLAALVLGAGLGGGAIQAQSEGDGSNGQSSFSMLSWLLAGVFPFTAPFVATWMLIGAGVAAGVPLLGGVAWLVALINGLTIALWGLVGMPSGRRATALAALSITLGVGAPVIVRGLIQPVVAQLQGGLTSYGDVAIWPWVGLATNDAANAQVTTLPSIAIAALMLVLAALVYVVLRLREIYAPAQAEPHPAGEAPAVDTASLREQLLRDLRDEVPWLGVLLGRRAQPEEAPREPE